MQFTVSVLDCAGFSFVNCPNSSSALTCINRNYSEALWCDPRNRKIVSLDAGSGNGLPPLIFSEFLFDRGFHVGLELCPGLVSNSMRNLKQLTAKGLVSLLAKKFDRDSVLKVGELGDNVPPRCHFVRGDIVSDYCSDVKFSVSFDRKLNQLSLSLPSSSHLGSIISQISQDSMSCISSTLSTQE